MEEQYPWYSWICYLFPQMGWGNCEHFFIIASTISCSKVISRRVSFLMGLGRVEDTNGLFFSKSGGEWE